MTVTLHHGDCLDVMRQMAADGVKVDSIVTDPPYHLTSIVKRFGGKNAAVAQHGTDGLYARASAGFMGKEWDGGDIAFRAETWRLAYDLLKPGGHIFAFSGTRTYHRMACAIEDAGFVIRDQFGWAYGSGFPKSHDISKAIDRAAGADRSGTGQTVRAGSRKARGGDELVGSVSVEAEKWKAVTVPATTEAAEWAGWGTAVKPAWEPVCLGQKPVEGTIAGNVLKHGTGALNIDGCRIEGKKDSGSEYQPFTHAGVRDDSGATGANRRAGGREGFDISLGRFPANLVHDGSEEVLECFPDCDGQQFAVGPQHGAKPSVNTYGDYGARHQFEPRGDSGSAARFFYSAKADADDRFGSRHPTVKPVDLIRYFARLITPPGGTVLDIFAGSGTLGVAAIAEGFDAVLIEREDEYAADIRERIAFYEGSSRHSSVSKNRNKAADSGPLFGDPGLRGGQTDLREVRRSNRTIGPTGLKW